MDSKDTNLKRRHFLLAVGAGGAGAAALVGAKVPTTTPKPSSGVPGKAAAGEISEHVRNYYRTTRI